MKKLLICSLLTLSMLLAACGGEAATQTSSTESPAPVSDAVSVESIAEGNEESTAESLPEQDDTALEDALADVDRLEEELADLRETLNGVNAELNALKGEKLAEEEYDVRSLGEIPFKGMLVETYLYHSDTKESEIAVYLRRYLDGKWEKLFDSPIHISTIAVSPDGTKIVFNDYDPDYTSRNYLFDMETRELTKLPIGDTDEERAVSYLGWLDDRYFLYVDQENYIACMGGTVCYYDTQTGEHAWLIKPDNDFEPHWEFDALLEIHRVDIWGDKVLVTVAAWDSTYNSYEILFYTYSKEMLYSCIEKGSRYSLRFEKHI
jgi:hypothetical protein